MPYSHTVQGERFKFADLRDLFAKANEIKSGDQLAGIAADSEQQRAAAKFALADTTLGEVIDRPLIDPDDDNVAALLATSLDENRVQPLRSWTIGQLREFLVSYECDEQWLVDTGRYLSADIVAAVAKLMSNKELVFVAARIRNVTRCRNTLGEKGVFAVRVQPNHPSDDVAGILVSALEGVAFGCGDAVLGVNPANDSPESVSAILFALQRLIETLQLPTQSCCLAHITTQLAALDQGAPVDLLFQSIGGTERTNDSFGVSLALLAEGRERTLQARSRRDVKWLGDQVMYFETGQGSALSADAHGGVDQLTLEARAYGLARDFDPFLVNSVVGFGNYAACSRRDCRVRSRSNSPFRSSPPVRHVHRP